MTPTHEFRFRAERLCLDFCATVVGRDRQSVDQLSAADDAGRWVTAAGLVPAATVTDLGDVHRVRESVHRLLRAHLSGAEPRSSDMDVVNAAAAAPPAQPRLAPTGSVTWAAADPVAAALSAIARDAIDLLSGPLAGRIRECGSGECGYLFADTSRAGNRRWCSTAVCGNRENVRSHRIRANHPQEND
ncbi:MAG: CGNR zinc finger domain-containing protein [Stackebrandtia sp.]